jgi:hypothetical protein
MTIRKLERQRCIAWMAVAAILLLSVVPTISQIVAAHAPHAHVSMTAAGHAHHMGHAPGSGDDQRRDRDDDCWRKCGYCDFLAHAPALATIASLPAFTGAVVPAPIDHRRIEPHHAKPTRVAQPRGPPAVLA